MEGAEQGVGKVMLRAGRADDGKLREGLADEGREGGSHSCKWRGEVVDCWGKLGAGGASYRDVLLRDPLWCTRRVLAAIS